MKARNREINIFNMSLLDILCGALGVFCFMTLVLFPYWRPTGASVEDLEKNKAAIEEELKRLKEKLGQSVDGKQALQQVEQLEQRMKQQQGDLNQARKKLAEQDKLIERLEMRNPIAVGAEWVTDHDVDVYLEPVNYGFGNGKKADRVDALRKQTTNFNGESLADHLRGPGADVWLKRDLVAGGEDKVYYKLTSTNGATGPVKVVGYYMANDRVHRLPDATLGPEKMALWVGTLKFGGDYKVSFEAAPALKDAFVRQSEKGAGK